MVALAIPAAALLVLGACHSTPAATSSGGGTLVWGASTDPTTLDPALTHDNESQRVLVQIYQGLTALKPGTTEIQPMLATSWTTSSDGLTYTFTLRDGVKFSDGTTFDASAVCFNFNRWYNFTGILQSPTLSNSWNTMFGGFADGKKASLFKSCQASNPTTAVITLTRASASFISVLSMPSFSMASPTALQQYGADDVTGSATTPTFNGTFATQHPVGTGPFMLQEWTRGDHLTLVPNPQYWGDKPSLSKIIFQPISDPTAQRQALQSGAIDGYDNVAPADIDALKSAGLQVVDRPSFNFGYVGFNESMAPLDNLKIRQAVAYALNRPALVKADYAAGAQVATQFQPPSMWGYAKDVVTYDYDPDKARQLIAESGVSNPTLTFWYPTGVTRPYLPDPAAVFQAFANDLTAVGFKVVAKSAPWSPDYLAATDAGTAQMYLLGWTGNFGDPSTFIDSFFGTYLPRFGLHDQSLIDQIAGAGTVSDQASRQKIYEDLNRHIMADILPGVPFVNAATYVALAPKVHGLVPGPTDADTFASVSVS